MQVQTYASRTPYPFGVRGNGNGFKNEVFDSNHFFQNFVLDYVLTTPSPEKNRGKSSKITKI